jgi:hypothetical protein
MEKVFISLRVNCISGTLFQEIKICQKENPLDLTVRSIENILKLFEVIDILIVQISWWSILLVEETGENHRPAASH